ncbi:peptidylprolyl isomerase [Prolixibacter sp. SD074]|uniref:peptidylprolyl isomerase n=1 Tax=Prolixibacter sp. SD074 TaxID=2652391 RepID=UPI001271A676|nr:peptidylprolyl isomerase [Prolixibacter sp. SD074]GET30370.1 peptidyl-prolyl cis-trans isomerase [Prolixibacter sp. SD074]
MQRKIHFLLALTILFLTSCSHSGKTEKQKRPVVLIKTEYGDMKVLLYNETPQHRDNFLKLVKQGFYNGLLFHRVIPEFMIQGGDPQSRDAEPGQMLGNGGPGYTLPAEFRPGFFHKKGALAAARLGDQANPEKRSSGSQFYIVEGKVFTPQALDSLETMQTQREAQDIYHQLFMKKADSVRILQEQGKQIEYADLLDRLEKQAQDSAALHPFHFAKQQRETYTAIGGVPHLDGNYTVFGEVIEGLNVIDSIAHVKTDDHDRPVKDVKMTMKILKD